MLGYITECDLVQADEEFPGILGFFASLTEKPLTFLDLVAAWLRRVEEGQLANAAGCVVEVAVVADQVASQLLSQEPRQGEPEARLSGQLAIEVLVSGQHARAPCRCHLRGGAPAIRRVRLATLARAAMQRRAGRGQPTERGLGDQAAHRVAPASFGRRPIR
jgi:hypothetical protein